MAPLSVKRNSSSGKRVTMELLLATEEGRFADVEVLLNRHSSEHEPANYNGEEWDINKIVHDEQGDTLLHKACHCSDPTRQLRLVRLLLHHNADWSKINHEKKNALAKAIDEDALEAALAMLPSAFVDGPGLCINYAVDVWHAVLRLESELKHNDVAHLDAIHSLGQRAQETAVALIHTLDARTAPAVFAREPGSRRRQVPREAYTDGARGAAPHQTDLVRIGVPPPAGFGAEHAHDGAAERAAGAGGLRRGQGPAEQFGLPPLLEAVRPRPPHDRRHHRQRRGDPAPRLPLPAT